MVRRLDLKYTCIPHVLKFSSYNPYFRIGYYSIDYKPLQWINLQICTFFYNYALSRSFLRIKIILKSDQLNGING